MQPLTQKLKSELRPYRDVILFVVAMLAANFFWKLTIHGDEEGFGAVTWLGVDITCWFDAMVRHTTIWAYRLAHLFLPDIYQIGENTIRHASGYGIKVIWGCTPLKQSFIFTCIMLATGPYFVRIHREHRLTALHKLWFLPVGWLLIYGFNILRIVGIVLLTHAHPEWFEVLHFYVFKYLFYGFIFLIWVFWVERINR